MSFTIRVNKIIPKSNVLFDCEYDRDLLSQIDKTDYTTAEINDGSKFKITVTADGYFPANIPSDGSEYLIANKNYTFTPELKTYATLTIVPHPERSKVVITYEGKDYEQTSLKVLTNTPIKYTVSKDKRETVSDTIIINGDKTVEVNLPVKIKGDLGIGKFEGNNSDKLTNITLVSEEQYKKLSKKQRSNYVRFDPWLHSYIGADVTKAINDCLVDLYWSLPIVKKLAPFTHGTFKFPNQTPFVETFAQLRSVIETAQTMGNTISRLQKAANKVGLGSITRIFQNIFALIGGMGGLIYSIFYNPQILIQPYAEMFKNYDLKDLYERTIGTTIPNLEYVKANLNRKYFPEGDVKDTLFGQIKQIDAATELSASILEVLQEMGETVITVEQASKTAEELLRLISTMGTDWAVGWLGEKVTKMKLEYDEVSNALNHDALSQASEAMIKNINSIMNNTETKYIHIQDLEAIKGFNENTTNTSITDYTNGYNDALKNGQDGETEEQMELRLAKYKADMEAAGKDPTSYIEGYKMGWKLGQKLLEAEKKNLDTEEKRLSYQNGYEDGSEYGSNVREIAESYLNSGEIYGFIDIDNHIHNYNYEPIGRIDGDKVLSFPDEEIIGSYDAEKKELIIRSIKYIIKDNIIINPSIHQDITEDVINNLCEYLHKLNLIMIERSDPKDGYMNPYYASGWEDGYKTKISINSEIHKSVEDDESGQEEGYRCASEIDNAGHTKTNEQCDEELFSELDEKIETYKTEHPNNYIYYGQGLARGANNFQSEYNEGYSGGWWTAMNSSDYDSEEEAQQLRNDALTEYCEDLGTTISEQESLPYIERKSYYRGWTEGWDDKYNSKPDPDYKQMYNYNNY